MRKITLLMMTLLMAVIAQAQQAAVVPADATIEEDWVCSFQLHSTGGDETVSETMQVAFSGSDVYFNLPNPIAGSTWVKGTLADGQATFAKGQYIGSYSGAVYMVGQDEQGICDLVFSYDEDSKTFSLSNMQLVLSASATAIDAWAYYTGMTVVKGGQVQGDEWTFTYTMHYLDNSNNEQTESGSEPISVQIDGNDVAICFPTPLTTDKTWIHGTLNGSTATFPIQAMGTYGTETFYLAGEDANGLCDVVFNYDAEQQVFTLGDMYVLLNSSATQKSAWCYFSAVTISKGAVPQAQDQLVELPSGLTQQDYVYTCKSIIYDQEGAIDHMEDLSWPVKVAFDGSDAVYVRGIYEPMPLSWAKGDIATGSWDEKIVTFAAPQYLGKFTSYDLYLMGKYMQVFGNAYLELDGQDMKNRGFIYVNTSKTQEAPLAVYANNSIKRLAVRAATPAAPTIEAIYDYNAEEGYAPLLLTVPTKDTEGNVIAMSRLGYRLITEKDGQQQVYTFTRAKYEDLPEEQMTIIPYELATGYNFYFGGSLLFVNDNLQANDRIGVQSVYTVGTTNYESEIAWHSFGSADGLQTAKAGAVRIESETYTDLQGRPASASTRGIVIRTQRLADGTVRTTKMVR
ncbi:MAG: hypothetical protein IJ612_01620 [Prevotella sp.]|nr:hypothetical protein [Prevotella sp.]